MSGADGSTGAPCDQLQDSLELVSRLSVVSRSVDRLTGFKSTERLSPLNRSLVDIAKCCSLIG